MMMAATHIIPCRCPLAEVQGDPSTRTFWVLFLSFAYTESLPSSWRRFCSSANFFMGSLKM